MTLGFIASWSAEENGLDLTLALGKTVSDQLIGHLVEFLATDAQRRGFLVVVRTEIVSQLNPPKTVRIDGVLR